MYEDVKAREIFTQEAISVHIESRARKRTQKILCKSDPFLFSFLLLINLLKTQYSYCLL